MRTGKKTFVLNNKKEFNHLTLTQLNEFYNHYVDLTDDLRELPELLQGNEHKFEKLLANTPPWSNWYELPFNTLLALSLSAFGILDDFIEASKKDDPEQALLDIYDSKSEFTDEEIEGHRVRSLILTLLKPKLRTNHLFIATDG